MINNSMQNNKDSMKANEFGNVLVQGHLRIFDPDTGEEHLNKGNAIHYENFSESLALSMANKSLGQIYQMSFGNGGSSVDPTGVITYLPTNTTGQNADLYNETYFKVVDDNLIANTDPLKNKLTVVHTSGKVYTDIQVNVILDFGEPADQSAFDNSTSLDGQYVFDEIGLKSWFGSENDLRLITHAIFHPLQKALNRRMAIFYTIRIQTLTNLSTT